MPDVIVLTSLVDASNNMMIDAGGNALVIQTFTPPPTPPRRFIPGFEWQGTDRLMEPNRSKMPF